jgi:hypothetical protein
MIGQFDIGASMQLFVLFRRQNRKDRGSARLAQSADNEAEIEISAAPPPEGQETKGVRWL